MPEITFFESPANFRRWLAKHHDSTDELWVGFHKKGSGRPSITWPESVREALCFGWIDGVRRSVDDESYTIRFTPRRQRSNWSAVNIQTANELIAAGLMQPAGHAAFAARSEERSEVYTYEQNDDAAEKYVAKELKKDRRAWAFFESQPPWYRRTASRWVMSAKREETRARRLATLLQDSARGETIKPLTRKPVKK